MNDLFDNDEFLLDSNKVFSVYEFTSCLKQKLELSFPELWISGEVSNLKRQSSGHIYFTLKDDLSQINCVMFKNDAKKSSFATLLQDADKILVFGKISVYEPRGTYQIITKLILSNGKGNLNLEFEKLKTKLESEGLFDENKKKQISVLPNKIAVISSQTGAAIEDFFSVLKRRNYLGEVVLYPCLVQGQKASKEIISRLLQAQKDCDLIVITRGGGSLEDLWCFNDEQLARAIYSCKIPIISAIGHQIDFTLCDFVSDKRAETPTAAAELISSNFLDMKNKYEDIKIEIYSIIENIFLEINHKLELANKQILSLNPERLLENRYLKLDEISSKLELIFNEKIDLKSKNLIIKNLFEKLEELNTTKFNQLKTSLKNKADILNSLNPKSILEKGYCIVKDTNKKVLSSSKGLKKKDILLIDFKDGQIMSEVK